MFFTVQVTKPPASAVRKFLSLLEQSDLDFSEEIECQRLKSQVVQQIRSNQQLEQDLRVIDLKIGLLVKNRLTIQVSILLVYYCILLVYCILCVIHVLWIFSDVVHV